MTLARLMLGIAIAALFLTEETRIALLVVAYLGYPLVMIALIAARRHREFARDHRSLWRLAWIAVGAVAAAWPLLLTAPTVPETVTSIPGFRLVGLCVLFAPVVLVSVATWLILPLPGFHARSRPSTSVRPARDR